MEGMDSLFDFGEAAMPDAPDLLNQSTNNNVDAASTQFGSCLLHPHDDG